MSFVTRMAHAVAYDIVCVVVLSVVYVTCVCVCVCVLLAVVNHACLCVLRFPWCLILVCVFIVLRF